METPSSPSELIRLNKEFQTSCDHLQFFAEAVSELMDELCPDPDQTLEAAKMLIHRLCVYHHSMLNDEDAVEPGSWNREVWLEDYESLKKASRQLRQLRYE